MFDDEELTESDYDEEKCMNASVRTMRICDNVISSPFCGMNNKHCYNRSEICGSTSTPLVWIARLCSGDNDDTEV